MEKDGLIAGLSWGLLPSVGYNKSSTQFLLITICELMLWRDLIGRSEKLDFALAFCYCNTCIWIEFKVSEILVDIVLSFEELVFHAF